MRLSGVAAAAFVLTCLACTGAGDELVDDEVPVEAPADGGEDEADEGDEGDEEGGDEEGGDEEDGGDAEEPEPTPEPEPAPSPPPAGGEPLCFSMSGAEKVDLKVLMSGTRVTGGHLKYTVGGVSGEASPITGTKAGKRYTVEGNGTVDGKAQQSVAVVQKTPKGLRMGINGKQLSGTLRPTDCR